jgi:hypothetical protein
LAKLLFGKNHYYFGKITITVRKNNYFGAIGNIRFGIILFGKTAI